MKTLAIVLLVCAAFSARTSAQTVGLPLRETLLQRPGQHPRAIYSMPVRVGSTRRSYRAENTRAAAVQEYLSARAKRRERVKVEQF